MDRFIFVRDWTFDDDRMIFLEIWILIALMANTLKFIFWGSFDWNNFTVLAINFEEIGRGGILIIILGVFKVGWWVFFGIIFEIVFYIGFFRILILILGDMRKLTFVEQRIISLIF